MSKITLKEEMKREKIQELETWKANPRRKPLLLMGARQVGKTWLMQEFGRMHYERTAYIRFDKDEELKQQFSTGGYNIPNLMTAIEARVGFKLQAGKHLIIFDEIQECPHALTSLKYFCEEAREHHIMAAGSLLGVHQHEGTGFPVGKVNMQTLYPLSFTEFLNAMGKEILCEQLKARNHQLISSFADTLTNMLRLYYYIGGMPEAVSSYLETQDFNEVRQVQDEILASYAADFSKHIPAALAAKVSMLWDSVPVQLAKENKRFIYKDVHKNMRAKDLEDALDWLLRAGLIYRVNRISKPALPINPYADGAFKVYFLDVGLLGAKTGIEAGVIIKGNTIFQEFKGALTEQYVQQQLRAECNVMPYYWLSESMRAEVDFLMEYHSTIVPIEVKAEQNLQAKSLKSYCNKHVPAVAVRCSMAPYFKQERLATTLIDLPLYAVCNITRECRDAIDEKQASNA